MSCEDCPGKISHSAWQKYMTCPKMYDYHYNERLRPIDNSSALAFGVAIDIGLNKLLLTKDLDAAILAFREAFVFEELENIRFDAKDFDATLVPPEDRGSNLEYNAWKSMRIKGRMLLEEYVRVILPQIEEVHHVQKELSGRPGVIDAIVTLRGHGRVILDHKTSVRPYDDDAVANDTQLALYCEDQGIKKAGFVVLIKTLNAKTVRTCTSCKFDGSSSKHKTCPNDINGKRCHGTWDERHEPEANVQLLVGEMPKATEALVKDSICQVESGIAAKIYPRNLKSCGRIYGKRCPYFDKCWNNSNKGLEIKEKLNEEKNSNN